MYRNQADALVIITTFLSFSPSKATRFLTELDGLLVSEWWPYTEVHSAILKHEEEKKASLNEPVSKSLHVGDSDQKKTELEENTDTDDK